MEKRNEIYRIDLNATPGFYFPLQIFDSRLTHKKHIKIAFSMNSQGFYSRVGLYASRYSISKKEVKLCKLIYCFLKINKTEQALQSKVCAKKC